MARKVEYSFSAPTPNKVEPAWHVIATPNAYAPTLRISFSSETEAAQWLRNEADNWLSRLKAHALRR